MPLEKNIEDWSVELAVKHGFLQLKLNVWGRKGWPDRMFVGYGKVLFVEFKKPGEDLEPLQVHIHKLLTAHGAHVYTFDDKDDLEYLLQTTREQS